MRRMIKRLVTLVAVSLLAFVVACIPLPEEMPPAPAPAPEPTPTAEQGIIEIHVTDPPPADVTSAVVYLTDIEVHKVSDNESEWIPIMEAPPSFDLLDVIGVKEVLGSASVAAGSFTQIRMYVDRVEVTTADGDNITAEVPSEKLKIVRPFNVEAGVKTVLTLDFDGKKSLILPGKDVATGKERAKFNPVVKLLVEKEEIEVEAEEGEEEEIEGEELRFEGTIEAIDGNIWTMAVEGESWTVDVSEAEIRGEPEVGLVVVVAGIVEDNTVIALEVEIEEEE